MPSSPHHRATLTPTRWPTRPTHISSLTRTGGVTGDSCYDLTVTASSDATMIGTTYAFGYNHRRPAAHTAESPTARGAEATPISPQQRDRVDRLPALQPVPAWFLGEPRPCPSRPARRDNLRRLPRGAARVRQ